ncbi:MAG: SpoIIE family protein phosphatase [Clostridia bacterium]|nr:SpoIIE family protein phosphatase [Clostridia bacterium]
MELRKETISARLAGWTRLKWTGWGINALMGAVFAAARFAGGMQPFGVAYAAAGGQALPAAMGAFASYLLLGGQTGLVSAAGTAVILTCRMVLDGTALSGKRWFYPACAATALFCTRFVITESLRGFLLLLCETALCGGLAVLLREGRDRRSPLSLWGRGTAGLCLLLAALPLRLGIFVPARMLAALAVLAAGCFGGGAAGACMGAIYGAGIDLAAGTGPCFALIWCVAGLCAGPGGRKDRLMATMSFCAAGGVICLWLSRESGAMAALVELFAAGAGFLLLPRGARVALETAFAKAGGAGGKRLRPGASRTLLSISAAVGQLGTAMDGLWDGASRDPGDLSTVYRSACETACRSCRRRDVCWQQEQGELKTMLADLAETLRSRHALELENLPSWFREKCLRSEQFCGAVNDAYREALRREARLRREDTVRRVMSAQYESLEALLDSVAGRAGMGADYDPALEDRVRRVVRAYLPRARTAVCLTGGRLQIDLLLPEGAGLSGDVETMLRSLRGALGVELLPPETVASRQGVCWRICQREKWRLEVRSAVRKKEGEVVCGDSFRQLCTDDGRAILLLSDGMGTGKQAGEISGRALELVSSFVRSGCSLAESTSAVLPVLAARFTEWGFVTLDLLEVNLFTGQAALLKYGAAPGFLLREGRLTQFSAGALPAGLEPPGKQTPAAHLRLREGDRIVLMSDGVWENPETEALLRDGSGMEGQALANVLIREAARKGLSDDMTVLTATFTAAQVF